MGNDATRPNDRLTPLYEIGSPGTTSLSCLYPSSSFTAALHSHILVYTSCLYHWLILHTLYALFVNELALALFFLIKCR